MTINRREFIRCMSAGSAFAGLAGCAANPGKPAGGRVVVIGAGYAGATAAKYIRVWSPDIEVTLVERDSEFISCPLSNLVIGGSKTIADVTVRYGGLAKYGVNHVGEGGVRVEPVKGEVGLGAGATVGLDPLIVVAGVELQVDSL